MIRLAVDVGGTFTDLVGFDETSGRLVTAKGLTTPVAQSEGVLDVIGQAEREHALVPDDVAYFVHGGTTVINALLERKGVKTAVVTTRGFRDVLEIGRGNRPDLYNLHARTPPPFVPRALRFEVTERLSAEGETVKPLAEDEIGAIAVACQEAGVEAVAVCFLHAYRNPAHERRCAQILRQLLPGVSVCASHEISRQWREYERSSTTALNAYVQPIAARYLTELSTALLGQGIREPHYVIQSHGGVARFDQAIAQPLSLVESGPAGGVAGAVRIGEALDLEDVLYLDVGGTTAKCCLIRNRRPEVLSLYRIERTRTSPGHAIQVPVVDIVEIGAGGGSIIRSDASGRLKVGPDSAGASPGPACYGLGGTDPTITDAAVTLGYLDPQTFAGGRMHLDAGAAAESLARAGAPLGLTPQQVASGAWQIALSSMISALKLVTIERGHDPRRLSLVVSGGAGPLFAAELGRMLGCKQTIIPPLPGNFSAWGMLAAAPTFHLKRSLLLPLSERSRPAVRNVFDELEQEAENYLGKSGRDCRALSLRHSLDMRYAGQEHSVSVMTDPAFAPEDIAAHFHKAHVLHFSFSLPDSAIEITSLGIEAAADVPLIGFAAAPVAQPAAGIAQRKHRPVYAASGSPMGRSSFSPEPWSVLERRHLRSGSEAPGPLLIEEDASTTVVPAGQSAQILEWGMISLRPIATASPGPID